MPFGRAFRVGILITLVTSFCYVATWEVMYFFFAPHHAQMMAEQARRKIETSEKSDAEKARELADLEQFWQRYRNPLFNSVVTFAEVFPVGLVMTLVSAGILSRRRSPARGLAGIPT